MTVRSSQNSDARAAQWLAQRIAAPWDTNHANAHQRAMGLHLLALLDMGEHCRAREAVYNMAEALGLYLAPRELEFAPTPRVPGLAGATAPSL